MVRIVIKPAGIVMLVAALGVLSFLAFSAQPKKPTTVAAAPAPSASPVVTVSGPSLLKNGDFEGTWRRAPAVALGSKAKIGGEIATEWQDNSDWGAITLKYASDKVAAHSGKACQRIDIGAIAPGGGQLQFVQSLPGTLKQQYRCSIWLKSSQPNTPCSVQLRQAGQPYTSFGSRSVTIGPTWQQVDVTATATLAGQMYFMVIVPKGNTTVWVDDATLSKAE